MYLLREFDKKCRNFFIIIHSQYNNIGKNETADLIINYLIISLIIIIIIQKKRKQ